MHSEGNANKIIDMKLLVGLGNPGEKYRDSRHNAGQMLADRLQSTDYGSEWKIEKTTTFMNESGRDVRRLANFYKVSNDDLYIAYDDLDIPLGVYKISKGKSPRVHNGINSVVEELGLGDFWHVRIGIDNRKNQIGSDRSDISGREYVLQVFTEEEQKILVDVLERIYTDLNVRL